MIHKPTIVRAVLFQAAKGAKPEAATVCDVVNEEDHVVNLSVISHGGTQRPEVSVSYRGDDDAAKESAGRCWYWPPRS